MTNNQYMDQEPLAETRPAGDVYTFNGQMLAVAAIATVFFFVFLLVSLHLYARWWLRRAAASRRRTHVVVLADGSSADGGLEPAVLSSLPVFTFSSKSPAPALEQERALLECAVCLSEFEEEETVRLLPRCNHAFHIECIDMWFHSHSTCPLCRSPVEPAAEPSPGPEPGSSSGCDLCATCQGGAERSSENANYGSTASFRRRKAMDVRIDVGPSEFESELTPGSPVTRLLSFKRLLSMRMKSPMGGRASPRNGAGTSRAAAELDLEGGLGEPVRVHTPK